ncbi:MAG: DUF655 domain-containing protein [archaeon]
MKNAIVLDKLKKETKFKSSPVILCVSTINFSLLEVYSDEAVRLQDIIDTDGKNVFRITYNKLTTIAKNELEKTLEKIVLDNETRFVDFFNTAKPIGLRRHQLDLLPMIGKRHRDIILKYLKDNGKFNSFDDIRKIPTIPDPLKMVVGRIIEELQGSEDKYHLFTIPFIKKTF